MILSILGFIQDWGGGGASGFGEFLGDEGLVLQFMSSAHVSFAALRAGLPVCVGYSGVCPFFGAGLSG